MFIDYHRNVRRGLIAALPLALVCFHAVASSIKAGVLRLYDRQFDAVAVSRLDTYYGSDHQGDDMTSTSVPAVASVIDGLGSVIDAHAAAKFNAFGDASLSVGYFDAYYTTKTWNGIDAETNFFVVVENVSGAPLPLKVKFFLPPARLEVIDATDLGTNGSRLVNDLQHPPSAHFHLQITARPGRWDYPLPASPTIDTQWNFFASLEGFRDDVNLSTIVGGLQSSIGGPDHSISTSERRGHAEAVTTVDFHAFTAELDLGTLLPDIQSPSSALTLVYSITAHASGTGGLFETGASAQVGDPFEFLGDPLYSSRLAFDPAIDASPPAVAVPEPATTAIWLIAAPAIAAAWRSHRESVPARQRCST